MSQTSSNNKRIAKNTLFLYVRMFITMLVSLYTSRIVLKYLGVVDYGILNVVGGFISMFGFITSTMTNASTRFFSYALGKGDVKDLEETFKTTLSIYLFLIVVILFIAETVGLWFVWYKLNIPPERHSAAMVVYQISLLTFCFGLFRIPYNSSIIAHEHMDFYAYTSVIEIVLKLLIVYLLTITSWDRLVFYNFMFFVVSLLVTVWFVTYCKRFEECGFGIKRNSGKFKEIFGFAGWNFATNMGDVAIGQGLNILINIYFGPAINAARGIAYQIKSQVSSFCCNFQLASSPQITKYYAEEDFMNMSRLVFLSSKMSFFLMMLVSVPAYVGMETILNLWLENVPEYTLILSRLAIVNILVSSLGGTLNIAIQASGKIKYYVLLLTAGKFLSFFVTLLLFKYTEATPEYSIYCTIIYAVISVTIQIIQFHLITKISLMTYINKVLVRACLVIFFSAGIILIASRYMYDPVQYVQMFSLMIFSFFVLLVSVYFIGLEKSERQSVRTLILSRLKK